MFCSGERSLCPATINRGVNDGRLKGVIVSTMILYHVLLLQDMSIVKVPGCISYMFAMFCSKVYVLPGNDGSGLLFVFTNLTVLLP